jgi:hypothetical protein
MHEGVTFVPFERVGPKARRRYSFAQASASQARVAPSTSGPTSASTRA